MALDISLEEALDSINLTTEISEDELSKIGSKLVELVEMDEDTRSDWLEQNKEWLKLATQIQENKSFPWPNAANVKYPLLTLAAIQFHARALPNLVKGNTPVLAKKIGKDDEMQTKTRRANRISKYMSYQILEEIDNWMDEMDRLLFVLPIVGICYKKTYHSALYGHHKSELVLPQDLIINYHAKDYRRARMTQKILMDQNELRELQLTGVYRDVDLGDPGQNQLNESLEDSQKLSHPSSSEEDPYEIYESHCWLDLDDDGYKEPYIVTVAAKSEEVLRIIPRWDSDGITRNASGEVARIEPVEYFTAFTFWPDPNSSVHGLGLGSLLGPMNEAVNTLTNQLIDAGTLSNLQGGFLARGTKLRGGTIRFTPGEWKVVNTTGDDLRKGIFPMPIREPSQVLFSLLSFLTEAGQQISSVSEMMMGQNPGQNQPATTSMAVLEQGLQVFSSIYKRQHRSLGKEFKKLYRLNALFLDVDEYTDVLDDPYFEAEDTPSPSEDFNMENVNIRPASDPNVVSNAQQLMRSQSLMEKMAAGLPLNVQMVTYKVLEAEGHEDIQELMNVPPPAPDPEQERENMKVQHEIEFDWANYELDVEKTQLDSIKTQAEATKAFAQAEAAEEETNLAAYRVTLEAAAQEAKAITDRLKVLQDKKKQESEQQKPKQEGMNE